MPVIAWTKPGLVLRPTGDIRHNADGTPISGIVRLEIDGDKGDFSLFQFDVAGQNLVDTWHQTVDDALEQAAFEFGIGPTDWVRVAT